MSNMDCLSFVRTLPNKLVGRQNYKYWRNIMELFLEVYGLKQFIQKEISDVGDETKEKVRLTLSLIHESIDKSIVGKISRAKTAKQAWDILEKSYRGIDKSQKNNILKLEKKFRLCKMRKHETIEEYFSRLLEIKDEMEFHGYTFDKSVFMDHVLKTLTRKFDYFVALIIEREDISSLIIDDLQNILILDEISMYWKQSVMEELLEHVSETHAYTDSIQESFNFESNTESQDMASKVIELEENKCTEIIEPDPMLVAELINAEGNNEEDLTVVSWVSKDIVNFDDIVKFDGIAEIWNVDERFWLEDEWGDMNRLSYQNEHFDKYVFTSNLKEISRVCDDVIGICKDDCKLYEKICLDEEWIDMDKFFDKDGFSPKIHGRYKVVFTVSLTIEEKNKCKVVLHVTYSAKEISKTIRARDDIGPVLIQVWFKGGYVSK